MLWGMLALAVPVAIHLWQRRQVKTMRFASLRFLKAIATKTTRMSRIENLLLLYLRCLLVTLLVLAFSRPVINATSQWLPGTNVPRTVVFIVDHSMSMNYRIGEHTRLDVAKSEAKTILNKLKEGDRVAVLSANDRVELPLGEPTLDRAEAARAIDQIKPTSAGTDLSPALLQARNILAKAPNGRREIFLLTDNQDIAWQFDRGQVFDETWKALNIELVTVQPDKSPSRNGSVKGLKIPALVFIPGSTVQAVANVVNGSDTPLQDVLSLECQGERGAQQAFNVEALGSADVPVEFPVPTSAERWVGGRASISTDNLPDDDHFYYVRPVYQQRPALIVSSSPTAADRIRADYYLRRAVSPQPNDVVSITSDALNDTSTDPYGTIFLVDPGVLNDRAVVKLNRFLENGGVVVYFPGAQTTADSAKNLDFLGAKPTGAHDLPAGRITTHILDTENPLFANVWDASTPFPAVPQRIAMGWKLGPTAKTLVTLGDTEPFIIATPRGSGLSLIINATADRGWGDFPLSSAFLPLLQQIRLLAASRAGNHLEYVVGAPVPWPAELPTDDTVTLTFPDHTTKTIGEKGEHDMLLDRAELPGIYQAQSARAQFWFVVNTDPRESKLSSVGGHAFSELNSQSNIETPEDLEVWLNTDHGLRPLWPAILLLAALVLCGEFLAANLFASRRTQGKETPLRTGRLFRRKPVRLGVRS